MQMFCSVSCKPINKSNGYDSTFDVLAVMLVNYMMIYVYKSMFFCVVYVCMYLCSWVVIFI